MIHWSIPAEELGGHSALATELFAIALALVLADLMVAAVVWIAAHDETGDVSGRAHIVLITLLLTAAGLLGLCASVWVLNLGNATSEQNLELNIQSTYSWDVLLLVVKHVVMVVALGIALVAAFKVNTRPYWQSARMAAIRWSPAMAAALGVATIALVLPA